jgi:hypothetical protein
MIQFDTAAIFEQIGGPAALRRALTTDYGYAPAEATVAMWKSRNRIASIWTAACVLAVLKRNLNTKLDQLLVDIPENPF